MSTFEVNILNRIKTVEHKISLLENENKSLRMLVEAVSTATTTPTVSTVKAAKEYKSPIATEQPLMRPPTFGGNVGGRRPITFRSTSTRPDAGTFTGTPGMGGPSSPAPGGAATTGGGSSPTTGGGQTPPQPTGPDYNGDGVVDGADLGIYNAFYGQPGFGPADLGSLLAAWNPDPGSGGGGGQTPQLPTGPDYNGDGVVDGADLGIFNSYYGQPGFDGAALGALLTAMGQSSSGGGGQEPPPPPPPPPSPTQPSIFRKSGTSTKDIASLSGQRYVSYT